MIFYFRCLAGGYPYPSYEWYREEHRSDGVIAKKINPLDPRNNRITVSGGNLIIYDPNNVSYMIQCPGKDASPKSNPSSISQVAS